MYNRLLINPPYASIFDMEVVLGKIAKIQLESIYNPLVYLEISNEITFSIGQYYSIQKNNQESNSIPLIIYPLYKISKYTVFSTTTDNWKPGEQIEIYGPLGNGFNIPQSVTRLGIIRIGDITPRIINLHHSFKGEIAYFTNQISKNIPTSIEVNPLSEFKEDIQWADFIAIETKISQFALIQDQLEIRSNLNLPQPIQVFIESPMPCSGLADCSVCSIKTDKWLYACHNGPVINLKHFQLTAV